MSETLLDDAPRRDLLATLALLAALLWWEGSGLDLMLASWYGSGTGFGLRSHWFFQRGLHDGGRMLSGVALAACAWWAWRGRARVMSRALRAAWLLVVLLCLVAVPALKQLSRTSCPWDLQAFGGVAEYVPHWLLGVVDGGPGHCFPSGHAVAAFAFLPLYFQWRPTHPRTARAARAHPGRGCGLRVGTAGARRALPEPHAVVGVAVLDARRHRGARARAARGGAAGRNRLERTRRCEALAWDLPRRRLHA